MRRRGEDFFRNFEDVLSYTLNNNIDLIVHGGDLFFRSKVPEFIVDRVYHTLTDFADHHIPLYIVPGNHERSRLPASLFLKHPYIHIFDRAKIFYRYCRNSRIILAGFPFIRDNIRRTFPKLLKQLDWNRQDADLKILLFHQTVEGATVGPGNFVFRNGQDILPLSLIPDDVNALLCGHIHRQQIFYKRTHQSSSAIPIIFSGSTERTSFAEKDEKKGFYHLTFGKRWRQHWELKETKFLELSCRPMTDIYIESGISGQSLESYLKGKIAQLDQNSIIRLRSHKPVSKELASIMTPSKIRHLLPAEMTFKFSSNFFNSHF
jgi:DNA repair exonuclease SbcCD nuclease subunit